MRIQIIQRIEAMSEHNCTGAEAAAIYRTYWTGQINKSAATMDPLAYFIQEMRSFGYPAIQASLMYNLMELAQAEIKKEMGNKLAKYLQELG